MFPVQGEATGASRITGDDPANQGSDGEGRAMNRCGVCSGPTLTGVICKAHWERLDALLGQCVGLEADLDAAIGKRLRFGAAGAVASGPTIPINPVAVDAKRALREALAGALERIEGPVRGLGMEEILSRLRACGRLRAHWTAPGLCAALEGLVSDAVAAVDRPRRRLAVHMPCPRCGGGPLFPAGGALSCRSCRELSSVGAVRAG